MSNFKYIQPISREERLAKKFYRPLKPVDEQIYKTTSFDIQKKFRKSFSVDNHPAKSSDNVVRNEGSNPNLLKTRIGEKGEKTCPVCTIVFIKQYSRHKGRRLDTQCCICWQIFESEEILEEHVKTYAQKKNCCSCKFITNKATKVFEEEEKFHGHIRRCCPIEKRPKQ